MEQRQGRSCAKFILGGEHGVVYRGRAIALPVRELGLTLRENPGFAGLRFNGDPLSTEAFERIRDVRGLIGPTSPLEGLEVQSSIPVASGLGSSAALCVAFARAHGLGGDQGERGRAVAEAALRGETFFHGKPSGVDPYTIATECPLVFEAGRRDYRALDLSKTSGFAFALLPSGKPHSTKDVIEAVQAFRGRSESTFDSLIDEIAGNTESMLEDFESGRLAELGKRMNRAQSLLAKLGVSCPEIEAACERLFELGAVGVKLTGSGCGGYVVGLFSTDRKRSVQTSGGGGERRGGEGNLPLVWTESLQRSGNP